MNQPAVHPAAASGPAISTDAAVIDIGSNSVRLVEFRLEGAALFPVFNEKVMAGLGRNMGETGRLHPEGVASALRALRRFARVLDAKGVAERYAVATAAVRLAADGADFVRQAEVLTGLRIRVLSGPEEGRISALGVLGGVGEAHGLAGDLGGSSLEFTPLDGRRAGRAVSLALGPLAFETGVETVSPAVREAVEMRLAEAAATLEGRGGTFYAVGGAWRAFARVAMAIDQHPIQLLHQYALPRARALKAASFAVTQSQASIASMRGVSAKRAWSVPYAAYLMHRILERGGFERVVFSANGLREGVIYEQHPGLLKSGEPLIEAAEAFARLGGPHPEFGAALHGFIEPVFAAEAAVFSPARDAVLRRAAASLADMGARMHPDHRADLCAQQVLFAPFGGVEHGERAFLARVLHHRYEGKKARPPECPTQRLLSEEQGDGALRLGLALRAGAALSGRSADILRLFQLERDGPALRLRVRPGYRDMVVERALQRFEQLAAAMKLDPEVI